MSPKLDNTHNRPPRKTTKVTHHPNGRVWCKTSYVNGKQHGMSTTWDEIGYKKIQSMWRENKLHGVSTRWFDANNKWYEQRWKDGVQHGVETWWDGANAISKELYYTHDKEEYAHIHWDSKRDVSEASFPNIEISSISKTTKSDRATIKKIK